MKLIKQKKLYFQEGTSDKIYEVDLCEVSNNQYLVNFRYGRRGNILKEGTKTVLPVELEAAEKIYDKLIAAKTKKGYTSSTTSPSTSTINDVNPAQVEKEDDFVPPIPTNAPLATGRIKGILDGLQKVIENSKTTTSPNSGNQVDAAPKKSIWKKIKDFRKDPAPTTNPNSSKKPKPKRPLSRLLWRVGELRLKEALPLLLDLKIPSDSIEQYCLVWALGRIGNPEGLTQLQKIRKSAHTSDAVSVITREAMMTLLSPEAQREMIVDLLTKLSIDAVNAISDKDEDGLVQAIEKEIQAKATIYWMISYLYLISKEYPVARKAILKWAKQAPLQGGGYFQALRQLFKSAEFRDDGELYGIIAHRIIQSPATISHLRWGSVKLDDQWVYKKQEIAKPNSRIGFTENTKAYLHRRVWRTFNRRGSIGDLSYIKMVVGFLLAYKDGDGQPAHQKTFWNYVRIDGRWRRQKREVNYPAFSNQVAFNHILYKNSTRFRISDGRKQYIGVADVPEGQDFSTIREEAFPELWDKMPQGLMHLLAESECLPVQEFACKAAKANNRAIGKMADVDFICLLLEKRYECTNHYAIDLARTKYNPDNPNFELTAALLRSSLDAARQLGIEWLTTSKSVYLKNADFVSAALFNPYPEVKECFDNLLSTFSYDNGSSESIVAKSMAKMLKYTADATSLDQQAILNAGELLKEHFQKQLHELDLNFVHKLLDHPLSAVNVFGAKILLNHKTQVKDLPEELILTLIEGESKELRAVGVQLLGKLPNEVLLGKEELLVSLCNAKYPEIRKEAQPIVIHLVKEDNTFGDQIVVRLAAVLLKKEPAEGRDDDVLELLLTHLKTHLGNIDKKLTLNLLYSSRKAANQLGSHLLQEYIDAKDLSILQIVKLASNEIVAVRRWVWKMYEDNLARIKYEAADAVRIVDAKWDDSRDFAFNFFDTHFGDKEWTPEILISLCDSVNPMVQQYGRNRITKYFRKEDGERYLLQLSQHPSADLQSFASNYLDEFAKDNPSNITELQHYFTTVLSSINKSKVAKKRIFDFLRKEGLKDKVAAQVIAEIMTRQSATMAIADKAKCISIMRDLKEKYPDLNLPIHIKPVSTYTKT